MSTIERLQKLTSEEPFLKKLFEDVLQEIKGINQKNKKDEMGSTVMLRSSPKTSNALVASWGERTSQ